MAVRVAAENMAVRSPLDDAQNAAARAYPPIGSSILKGTFVTAAEDGDDRFYYVPPTPPLIKKQKEEKEEEKIRLERRAWQKEREQMARKIDTLEQIIERSKIPHPHNFQQEKNPRKYYKQTTKFYGGPHVCSSPSPAPVQRVVPLQQVSLPDLRSLDPGKWNHPARGGVALPEKSARGASSTITATLVGGTQAGGNATLRRVGQEFVWRQELKSVNYKRMDAYGGCLWSVFRDWHKSMEKPVYKAVVVKPKTGGVGPTPR